MAASFATRHCINRAKLVKRATPAETRFLHYLESLGLSYRFQQGFFTPCYRIADFYLPDLNLVVEIDGPYHCAYHDAEEDRRKDALFEQARGIRTVRFTNAHVMSADFDLIPVFVPGNRQSRETQL